MVKAELITTVKSRGQCRLGWVTASDCSVPSVCSDMKDRGGGGGLEP